MPIPNPAHNLMMKCDCSTHLLEIDNDITWFDEDKCEPFINFSIWNQSPYPINFRERIKLIFSLLRGKSLSGGDVLLKRKDAQAVVTFLTKQLRYNKQKLASLKQNDKNTKAIKAIR